MVLYHSTDDPETVEELLWAHADDVLYATATPQQDYGAYVCRLEVKDDVDLTDSYDNGHGVSLTGNVSVCCHDINSMEVLHA